MLILGLTGSIAMGKSVAARLLRRRRIPVHDADAAVHAMLARGGVAVPLIAQAFPDVVKDGAVDRKALGARVFGDQPALRRLEAIIHPLAQASAARFCAAAARRRAKLVVLDIPLLYETKGDTRVDAVLVVSAPAWLQRARALRRPGMTQARLDAILKLQLPDATKRRRADAVITSAQGVAATERGLRLALVRLAQRGGRRRWKPGWR